MDPNTPTPHMVRIRIGLTQEVATRLAQALTAAGFAAEIEYLDGSGDYTVRVLDRHAAHGATWAQGYMAGKRGHVEDSVCPIGEELQQQLEAANDQRDDLLTAAQFTLSVMKTNHLDIELSEKLAIEKLEAAIAKASPPAW